MSIISFVGSDSYSLFCEKIRSRAIKTIIKNPAINISKKLYNLKSSRLVTKPPNKKPRRKNDRLCNSVYALSIK